MSTKNVIFLISAHLKTFISYIIDVLVRILFIIIINDTHNAIYLNREIITFGVEYNCNKHKN